MSRFYSSGKILFTPIFISKSPKFIGSYLPGLPKRYHGAPYLLMSDMSGILSGRIMGNNEIKMLAR